MLFGGWTTWGLHLRCECGFCKLDSLTQVVVGKGKHKLQLYDTKRRRPVLQLAWGEARITALAPEPSGESWLPKQGPTLLIWRF